MMEGEYSGTLLFPRLPSSAGRRILASFRDLELEDIKAESLMNHPSAAPGPVGGRPATEEHLARVQTQVRDLACEFGFPDRLTARDQATFDRACATLLLKTMDIVTGDAAAPEVWSFMSLVLLPEIPFWRFPDAADERYIGGARNTLQRLWWRAWTLGPDLSTVPAGASPFGEDDFVQVMERPTVSGNERLARSFYQVVLESDLAAMKVTRSELVRTLVMQIRARRSHIAVDALGDQQLIDLIRGIRDGL